jgi:hypothetical protein
MSASSASLREWMPMDARDLREIDEDPMILPLKNTERYSKS